MGIHQPTTSPQDTTPTNGGIPTNTTQRFLDTEMGLNQTQFGYGIPEPPTGPYSTFELHKLLKRLNEAKAFPTLQGVVNGIAAFFDRETYTAVPRRGFYLEIPSDLSFSVPNYHDLPATVTHYVGAHDGAKTYYEWDANGNFIAPSAPVIPAGSYADTAYVYGQPDVVINKGEDASVAITLEDGQRITYSFTGVDGIESFEDLDAKEERPIIVYSFHDPDTVRSVLTGEIYNRISTANGTNDRRFGWTWGTFYWDRYRWNQEKPGGLYPAKFDSLSLEAGAGNHYHGIVRNTTDFVLQAETDDEGYIQVTTGQFMWNGIKYYMAGKLQQSTAENLDDSTPDMTVTAEFADNAPTVVLTSSLPQFNTNTPAAWEVLEAIDDGSWTDNGNDTVSFTMTEDITDTRLYEFELVKAGGDIYHLNKAPTVLNYTTGAVTLPLEVLDDPAADPQTWTVVAIGAGDVINVYESPYAVPAALGEDLLVNGSYYPLFQHPYSIMYNGAETAYDPNTITIQGTNRQVLPKVTGPVVADTINNSLPTYLKELNYRLDNVKVNGSTGTVAFTERSGDGYRTVSIRNSNPLITTFSADDCLYLSDADTDGIMSLPIPRDTQQYDVERGIISIAEIGDLGTVIIKATELVVAQGADVTLIVIVKDVNGNRMGNVLFKMDEDTGDVANATPVESRLDGVLFYTISSIDFSGANTLTYSLDVRYDETDTTITKDVTFYKDS